MSQISVTVCDIEKLIYIFLCFLFYVGKSSNMMGFLVRNVLKFRSPNQRSIKS